MRHDTLDNTLDNELETRLEDKRDRRRGVSLAPIVLFVSLWLGGSWLVVGSVMAPDLPGGWVTVLFLPILFAVPIRALARGFGGISYPSRATRLWLFRPFWYAMLLLPVLAMATFLGLIAGAALGSPREIARLVLLTCASLLLLFAVAGYFGSRRLVVRHLEVNLPDLPPAWDGLLIAQISDLHVGPHTPRRFLAAVADGVMQAAPDLIVFTGDQVDDFPPDVEIFCEAFRSLDAPLGVFAVAGNHDIYAGWQPVRLGLEAGGIEVLENDAVAFEREGHRFWLAGTGDPAAGSPLAEAGPGAPDISKTLANVPASEFVVALAHNPALWPALATSHVDLTLSGHTHYGQFAIPWLGWCLASPFLQLAMGTHQRGNALLYINPGTNYWGVPLRLGTPPEVTILTLRQSELSQIRPRNSCRSLTFRRETLQR